MEVRPIGYVNQTILDAHGNLTISGMYRIEGQCGEGLLPIYSSAEIARLQADVERWKNTVTEMLNAVENDPRHIRDTAHNDAIEAMQAHIKPKSITDWDVKEPDYYYALAHEHMWEDLECMKR